jgi:hypothetical protein
VFEREVEEEYLWPEGFLNLLKKASTLVPLPETKFEPPKLEEVGAKNLEGKKICGVDGSHAGKELSGFYFGIVAAMAYTSDWRVIKDEHPIFEGKVCRYSSVMGSTWLSLDETILVFKAARRAVEERKPDWILIDGPLLIYPGLVYAEDKDGMDITEPSLFGRDYKRALAECVLEVLRFLFTCRERNIPVVGVIKRVRSSLFDKERRRRDAALLNRYMRYAQMTEPRGPGRHPSLEEYGKVATEEGLKPEVEWKDFFRVVYLKSSKVKPPFRLEVPFWVDPKEAASVVLAVSDPITGVPVHIQKVEGLIKMGQETLKSIYLRMLSQHPESTDDLIPLHGEEFLGQRWESA